MVATQLFFIFIPNLGEDDPIWRAYFSNGLKPPTSHVDGSPVWCQLPSWGSRFRHGRTCLQLWPTFACVWMGSRLVGWMTCHPSPWCYLLQVLRVGECFPNLFTILVKSFWCLHVNIVKNTYRYLERHIELTCAPFHWLCWSWGVYVVGLLTPSCSTWPEFLVTLETAYGRYHHTDLY